MSDVDKVLAESAFDKFVDHLRDKATKKNPPPTAPEPQPVDLSKYKSGDKTSLEEILFAMSGDGADEETGDVNIQGYFELFRPPFTNVPDSYRDEFEQLDRDTQEELVNKTEGGYILSTNGQGFRSVDSYATDESLDAAWAECEEISNPPDDEQDDS